MRGTWRIRQWWQRARAKRALSLAEKRVRCFPNVQRKRPHDLPGELVVSLTSYPARYHTLASTVISILDQSMAADQTILWLAHGETDSLPYDVSALIDHGLTIRECPDIRSYKKIIPTIREFPDSFIVTADDDVYYKPDWLAKLVDAYDTQSPAILAHRCNLTQSNRDGSFEPYRNWVLNTDALVDVEPGKLIFPTGVGGVLYPPNSLGPDVLDEALFLKLCPHGDDLWLFWMAERAGTEHRRVPGHVEEPIHWKGSQDIGLVHHNLTNDGNDPQIKALEAHFGR